MGLALNNLQRLICLKTQTNKQSEYFFFCLYFLTHIHVALPVTVQGIRLRGSYHCAEIQSLYSATPADWATGHSLEGDITRLQRCSRYNLQS